MIRAIAALVAAMLLPVAAPAQPVVSPGPDSVAVTIYRASGRSAATPMSLDWLHGFALITEKRTVAIPAGRAVIRFEGVAGGIIPESAIITGLPDGVREKNLDADLLNPRSLYARSFGRPVTIRRSFEGRQVEERAIIRSGPDGAAILETRDGFIAANCDLSEDELVYDSVPTGLSPRPTLSVETVAQQSGTVTLTLSYLATHFDWQANYVATMRPDGRSADLLGWVTLASGDVTSFADAETMVVAGRLAEDENAVDPWSELEEQGDEFEMLCFAGAEPNEPVLGARMPVLAAPEPMPAPPAPAGEEDERIIVTGSRIVRQEDLGDLKLYRVPDRTTVASKSQKQVMLLRPRAVKLDMLYKTTVWNDEADERPGLLLRARNRKADGLGLPLPAGGVALFERRDGASLLIGEAEIEDKAVDEEIELNFQPSSQVRVKLEDVTADDAALEVEEYRLTVTNANSWPVRFEADFVIQERNRFSHPSARMGRRNGRDTWSTEVPANGSASFRYRLTDID